MRPAWAAVYGLALRVTRHAAQAEEVTEDAFWQIWREAPRFDPARGSAMAWILTITRSRALDSLRARDPAELVEDSAAMLDAQPGHDAGPLDLLSATQSDQALHHALSQLDAQPRQLIALAFFKGLTHDEIATHTGLPLGTVKSHIRRSLAALKTLLGHAAETQTKDAMKPHVTPDHNRRRRRARCRQRGTATTHCAGAGPAAAGGRSRSVAATTACRAHRAKRCAPSRPAHVPARR